MITEFTIKVYGETQEEAFAEMSEVASSFLSLARFLADGASSWKCVEDYMAPDQSWVPGFGSRGLVKGYKVYKKFIQQEEEESP